ncbi:BtrH N-terminal domain-containing protein [Paenibacillus campi]|uniref:BtrH N-terminal domain-containing protein n=1 Tax=Paenibacillus campi TaxID=3106031 RepID=UPI002AFECDDF|nr:BtrH N-terminal domain-containing protein [Paenibacillus sp. SGZ-1009]
MPQSHRIPLKPLQGFDWSSLTGNVASAAAYFSSDYMYAFADAWTFSYFTAHKSQAVPSLGQEAVLYNTSYERILKWSGLGYQMERYLPAEEALAMIRMELAQERPVLVKGDTYYCPWFPANYGRLHQPHFYLITGYDDLTNELFCTDVAYMTYHRAQSVSDFSLGFAGDLLTLYHNHDQYNRHVQPPDLYELLTRRATNNLGRGEGAFSIFDSMRQMANNFTELDRLSCEQQLHSGSDMNPLHLELLYIMQARMQFVHLLQQKCVHSDPFIEHIIGAFHETLRSWTLIRTAYLHSLEPRMQRETILHNITEHIRATANLEQSIADSILHNNRLGQIVNDYKLRVRPRAEQ